MSKLSFDTSKVSFVEVTQDNAGQRVDNFLISLLKGAPKTLVYRIIRKGEVRVNKGRVKADTKLQSGDLVRIPPVRLAKKEEVPDVSPALSGLLQDSVLYEDDSLLAVNKPHGLAVHGGSGVSLGLIEALRKMRPDHSFLELVHRLDRDTSGVILIAKKRAALTSLQRMLANKKGIRKQYLALVHGIWDQGKKLVDLPLLRTERQSGERIVVVSAEGKPSLTKTKLMKKGQNYSLIQAEPVTGRTHQIRVHTLYNGHVIAGDQKYSDRVDAEKDKSMQVRRLCLHAWRLSFRHPITGEPVSIEAPIDPELKAIYRSVDCLAEDVL